MVAAVEDHGRETSVEEVSTIGLDLAKHVFQAHGASASGAVLFRKRLRREQVLRFFASQPRCRVAMEACASGHYWARAISDLGHEVRLIPPAYVKPFVKRQKNDMADAEAICEAAQRPTMRFVAVKTEAKQAAAVIFRARDLLVGQRTQIINALRGHLAEYGLIAPQGPSHIERLIAQIEDPACGIPEVARSCLGRLIEMLRHLQDEITTLDREITVRAKSDDVARRLMTIPGIGPLIATARTLRRPPRPSARVATSRPGSASRQFNDRPAARNALAEPRAWASARSDVCSSLRPAPSCAGPSAKVSRPAPGLRACSRASRRCW
jgi:transposase